MFEAFLSFSQVEEYIALQLLEHDHLKKPTKPQKGVALIRKGGSLIHSMNLIRLWRELIIIRMVFVFWTYD
jgi:predicted transcriptional regulator